MIAFLGDETPIRPIHKVPRQDHSPESTDHESEQADTQDPGRAASRAHPEVGTIHLLMAFLEQEQGVLPRILTRLGVSSQVLQQELENRLHGRATLSGERVTLPMDAEVRELLSKAAASADQMRDEFISVEHVVFVHAGGV